jgi:hypothetical protein
MRPRLAALILLAWALACAGSATDAPRADPDAQHGPGEGALFIGNSLTYANDLPGLVSALAAADGKRLPPSSHTEDLRSPVGLPAILRTTSGIDVTIPTPTARLLQEAAEAANAQFARP